MELEEVDNWRRGVRMGRYHLVDAARHVTWSILTFWILVILSSMHGEWNVHELSKHASFRPVGGKRNSAKGWK